MEQNKKQTYSRLSKVATVGLLTPAVGFLMGNTSCQQQAAAPQRSLKRLIALSPIVSPPIVVDSNAFDLATIANNEIAGVLSTSTSFVLQAVPPVTSATPGSVIAHSLAANNDRSLLLKTMAATGSDGSAPATTTGSNGVVNWSTEASCMVNKPMAQVSSTINDFEMLGGGGLSVGFSPAGAISSPISNIGAGFKVDIAQMGMSTKAVDPMGGSILSAINLTQNQTKIAGNFTISIAQFMAGPSFYYNTPLHTMMVSALTTSFSQLQADMDAKPTDDWYTRVMVNMSTHVAIVGGGNVGLQVGDEVVMYNNLYYWDGEPCHSTYRGGDPATGPVAIGVIESVGIDMSIVKLTMRNNDNVVVGAQVKVSKLLGNTSGATIDRSGLTAVGGGSTTP